MSMPADPALSALAEEHGVGSFRARYAVFKEAYRSGLYTLAASLLLPVAIASYVLAPGSVPLWGFLLLGGLGVAGLIMGSRLLYPLPFIKLQTHERGFVYKSHRGVDVVPYADVVGVQARVTTTTQRQDGDSFSSRSGQLEAYLRDGRRVSVNPNLEDVGAFMDELVDGAAVAVIAACASDVGAKKTFSCGAIAFGPEGISVEGRTHPYSAKPRVRVEADETRVYAKNKVVAKLKTKNVVNAPYMESLVEAAAKAVGAPGNTVRIDLDVIAAHEALDAAVIEAVRSIAPADWPVVVVEMGISDRLQNLVVMDRSGAMLPPNAALMGLGDRVAEIHSRHATGANRVRFTLGNEPSGWSVASEFLKEG